MAGAAAGLIAEAVVIAGSTESEGRTLAEVASYSADPLDFLSRWRLHGPERFVYLGWLLPVLAIAGLVLLARRRRGLAILLGIAAVVPALLALGTNLPLYETVRDVFPPLRYPRVPGRFLPLANLALAALAAVAVAVVLARLEGRRRVAIGAAALALVAADLLVFPLGSSDADPGNAAYAALGESGPGRVLELPIFQEGRGHFGSVYQYYTQQAPRERPTGYALAPEEVYEFTERFNRLDCGAWLQGDTAELERLGVAYLVWHGGLYRQSETPGAWFGWEGLRRGGRGVVAGTPPVFLWEEGLGADVPPDEPDRDEPLLCDAWVDGELTLQEGALWLYGQGVAELELEAPAPTAVTVYADARAGRAGRRRGPDDDPRRASEPRLAPVRRSGGARSAPPSCGVRVSDTSRVDSEGVQRMSVLIKRERVVTAADDHVADVFAEDQRSFRLRFGEQLTAAAGAAA